MIYVHYIDKGAVKPRTDELGNVRDDSVDCLIKFPSAVAFLEFKTKVERGYISGVRLFPEIRKIFSNDLDFASPVLDHPIPCLTWQNVDV